MSPIWSFKMPTYGVPYPPYPNEAHFNRTLPGAHRNKAQKPACEFSRPWAVSETSSSKVLCQKTLFASLSAIPTALSVLAERTPVASQRCRSLRRDRTWSHSHWDFLSPSAYLFSVQERVYARVSFAKHMSKPSLEEWTTYSDLAPLSYAVHDWKICIVHVAWNANFKPLHPTLYHLHCRFAD